MDQPTKSIKSHTEHVELNAVDEITSCKADVAYDENVNSIEDTAPGSFVWLCAASTAIGGMLFGYDTGVISGVLVVIGTDLNNRPLSNAEKELITALCAAGAFLGAIYAGMTADRYGRKPAIWFASVLFTLGAVVQSSSYTIAQMSVGRILIGLGVGSASTVSPYRTLSSRHWLYYTNLYQIVPMYIAEISPAHFRGRMISIDMIFLGTGSVLAYAFDAAFYHVPHGWRYMIGLGGIPSIILGIFLFWCPESPRQLLYHNQPEECARVIRRIYSNATEDQIQQKILSILEGINRAKQLNEEFSTRKSLKQLFLVPGNVRALIAACGLMAFQQFCGFNTLMYYSSTLFQIVGFSNPIAVGTVVAVTNLIFTVLSIIFIDRIGRRRILLWTAWGMPVCLIIASGAFTKVPIDQQTLKLTNDHVGWPAILVLVCMILFVAFYAAGLGCVPWQANEFLPMEVRAMGTMCINMCNWGPNIVVSSTFLSMMKTMSPAGTFGFYAGLCLVGFLFVYFCFPEAANMTLEEIRMVFANGFGVEYAEEWRKERRERCRNGAA
ncbi:hypothetical protein EIK77_000513 [Talaromyces pinophilus]|nr:hypothetical protein EIK77_000513 [Talaromyces pinophilus]